MDTSVKCLDEVTSHSWMNYINFPPGCNICDFQPTTSIKNSAISHIYLDKLKKEQTYKRNLGKLLKYRKYK
jgi:hypothetical protein